jgi:superfamily II DNA/RNA helicase
MSLSGTGETATMAISILQTIDVDQRNCQALVLAPTRELAQHTTEFISTLGAYMDIKAYACVGGTAIREDINTLKDGVHVVVGTPGRVNDMIKRGVLKLDHIKIFILYAADILLVDQFNKQIQDVFKHVPEGVQCAIFSAQDIIDDTSEIMRDPIRIVIKKDGVTSETEKPNSKVTRTKGRQSKRIVSWGIYTYMYMNIYKRFQKATTYYLTQIDMYIHRKTIKMHKVVRLNAVIEK